MTTQYTPILKLALPVQGELSGTWGDVVNDNITSMIEQAIAGRSVVNTWAANSHVLTTANGTAAESRAAMLSLTDTGTALTGAGSVVCPALSKTYIVKNGTAQVITVKTASGSGIAVPVGKTMLVYCDGTNVLEGVDHVVTLSAGTLTITGLTTFASLKGADATTVTGILDEDNMASDSATKLVTQQSVKAYVDSQVGANNELSEVLANGNTTGSNDIDVDAAQKVQFRDASIYINSSADGQLDIVADTEIQIATATVDLNGNLDVSGTALVTGTLDVDGATQLDSTLTVGVNDTGHDVKFFGASSGAYMLWDESEDDLILGGAAGLNVVGTATFTTEITANGGIALPDNGKATFGAGDDLQIYHDGSNSYVKDVGTGNLVLQGANIEILDSGGDRHAFFAENNASTFYYNGSAKLATTATGIDVTGNITGLGKIISDSFQIERTNGEVYVQPVANAGVKLFWNGAERLDTTSTGIDVTGTATVDGLSSSGALVLGVAGSTNGFINTGESLYINIDSNNDQADSRLFQVAKNSTDTTGGKILLALENGDISFYEDTGTTPKLFWDASAESLGIGTSSPNQKLSIENNGTTFYSDAGFTNANSTSDLYIGVGGSAVSNTNLRNNAYVLAGNAGSNLILGTDATERMRIDSSGNVGIGGNGTGNSLGVYLNKGAVANFYEASDGTKTMITGTDAGNDYVKIGSLSAHPVGFVVGNGEKMRIDSSGNVLVGSPSTPSGSTDGTVIFASGTIAAYRTAAAPAVFSRNAATGGDVVVIQQQGTTVGSIGYNIGALTLDGGVSRSGLYFGDGAILPRYNGSLVNGVNADLGATGQQFQDLYLSGSVVAGTGATNAATLNAYSKTVSANLPSALRIIENTGASSYWDIGSTDGATNNLNFYANANTTPKMTLSGAGNVGIGTSPDFPLHVSSTGVVLGLNATSGAVSQRFNENGTARFFLSTLNGSNGLAFVNGDGTSERMRIDASGHAIIPAGVTLGTATGVYNAANTLDDYEEGTWTPAFTNIGTGTYGVQLGRYTKVGNLVTATFHLDIGTLGSATGALIVSGLPFISVNVTNNYGTCTTTYASAWDAGYMNLGGLLGANQTAMTVNYQNASGTMTAATHANMQVGNLIATIIYEAL